MPAETLTRARIVEATEQVLRRHGPAKTNVVDVARALGVSHASVYRHFPSKAALRDAVAEHWLATISAPLAAIAGGSGPAPDRLRRWLDALVAAKRHRAADDPELFATYVALTVDARDVVRSHVDALAGQLARIVRDGVAEGTLEAADPDAAARAVFAATSRFHDPAHASRWSEPGLDDVYRNVRDLVLAGLEPRRPRRRPR